MGAAYALPMIDAASLFMTLSLVFGMSPQLAANIAEQAPIAAAESRAPDWTMRATLYHQGGGGAGPRDSLGCPPIPLRTAATDRGVAPRRSIIFIRQTVGIPLPNGGRHNGLWYVSDVGPAVRGHHIDLFTGMGRRSMDPIMHLNVSNVDIVRMGTFEGCPPSDS